MFKVNSGKITSVDIFYDASMIVCGSSEGSLTVFRSQSPYEVLSSQTAHAAGISAVKFSPTESLIASGSLDGTVKLWNTNQMEGQAVVFDEHDSWVWGLTFNLDGTQLASCGKDKSVRTYNVSSSKMVKFIESNINRNLSIAEWEKFVGKDIPYEKTLK